VIENKDNHDIFNLLLFFCSYSPKLACIRAEAASVGNAYVSAVDDLTAVYWNTANRKSGKEGV
jgi:hypothetical protein